MSLYASSGVDYDVLDAGKRVAVAAALSTTPFSFPRGAQGIDASRGEPAFVFQQGDRYYSMVLECLGTKSTIARQYQEETGMDRFSHIGYDSVAAIANDIVCVGALPLVVNAYFATGSPQWYGVKGRFESLVNGWSKACKDAGATWGGGESPALSGIIDDAEIDLAGSAVGVLPEGKQPILGQELAPGDEIVFIGSSGLHANGASLVRKIVKELPGGYATKLPSGETFGDGVLSASVMYVALVEALQASNLPITYLSHITGHGFRKIMRANQNVSYRITSVPPIPESLQFIVEHTEMSPSEAYGTFNMGAGFAVYCKSGSAQQVLECAVQAGYEAWISGVVEEGPRSVIVEPIDVIYSDEDLQLR